MIKYFHHLYLNIIQKNTLPTWCYFNFYDVIKKIFCRVSAVEVCMTFSKYRINKKIIRKILPTVYQILILRQVLLGFPPVSDYTGFRNKDYIKKIKYISHL
jgi:hypothetical protein